MPAKTSTEIYYLRDENGAPRMTVAVGLTPSGKFVRGIAICAPGDQVEKKVGREKALGRLAAAIKHRSQREQVVATDARNCPRPVFRKFDEVVKDGKSAYDVRPTRFEKKLLSE